MGVQRRRGTGLKLSARHIGELAGELTDLLRGHRITEVQALPPRDLLLILEPPTSGAGPAIRRLRLSADPEAARLHVQQGRVRRHKGGVGPFFALAEKELAGAIFRKVEQVGGDRIALCECGETPSGKRRALLLEVFGRHANMILLGPGDEVLDMLVPAPAKKEGARLVIGRPWSPPGGAARGPERDPGPPLAEALPPANDLPPSGYVPEAPLSWQVEVALGTQAEGERRAALLRKLNSRIARKLSRAKAQVAGLEKRERATDQAERVRNDGELLKGALGRIERGADSIVLQDYFAEDCPDRRISLDPAKSPQANLQRIFDRYHKLERSARNLGEELERARTRLELMLALQAEAAAEGADPEAVDKGAVEAGLLDRLQVADPRKRKAAAPRQPYKRFRTLAGLEVRVGRTSRDNDDLTFHHSRGNDLWLHTADAPGSHVILRIDKGQQAGDEDILDAAHLAVHFSPLEGTDRAAVHVVPRKQVHKPRGAKSGLVTLAGGRRQQVRMQPERLERLLRSTRSV